MLPRASLALRPLSRQASSTASAMSSDLYVAVHDGQAVTSSIPAGVTSEVSRLWSVSKPKNKAGETRTFYGVEGQTVVAVHAGKKGKDDNALKESSRRTAALATLALKAANSKEFKIDPLYSPHAAATGATLASWVWNLKSTTDAKALLEPVTISPAVDAAPSLASETGEDGLIKLDWASGEIYGQAQNFARELMELPANRCTPTIFTELAKDKFKGLDVEINVYDKAWAQERKMGSFLSVNAGTAEPLKFLEIIYKGDANKDAAPLAFVGKGITFDSGGISLKPGAAMKEMRADMGGAATTLASAWAIAKLKIPINFVLCCPLTENMPSGTATKPGDIVVASNGVTIEVDNTDAEGRLVLADALYYCTSVHKPHSVIDVATLTGAMMIALGNQFAGVFSNSDDLYSEIEVASKSENDRVWRMPLDEGYMSQINTTGMDLCNTGGRLAGSCTAAIFLSRFIDGLIVDGKPSDKDASELIRWAHIDIAGVMDLSKPDAYNRAGMTGRRVV
ncbi:leucyl aminopeptidase [Pseudohyphozyma bogoriensis]|nr:leucyl aminopeptidase [Pseudohyphozyma bogoriensis]